MGTDPQSKPCYLDNFSIEKVLPITQITNIVYDSAGTTVEWISTPGSSYSIYWKDDMNGSWAKAADVTATTDVTDWTDVGGSGRTDPRDSSVNKRFYMVLGP